MAVGSCSIPVRYRPRRPTDSPIYRLVQDHYDEFRGVYDERFAAEYGFWRREIDSTVYAFLDCGVPQLGLARLRCRDCGRELYLPFSCKTRCFCTSCQAKRAVLWAEWLCDEVLAPVVHYHLTFTIPKRLRRFFRFDRRLLGDLSRCAWMTLRRLYREASDEPDAVPGLVVAIQTFGAQANFHPHLHGLLSAGVFSPDASFTYLPAPDPQRAEALFQHRVLRLLVRKGLLDRDHAESMLAWPHSGFQVFVSRSVSAADRDGTERLGRYLLHPPLSIDRIHYPGPGQPCTVRPSRPDPKTGSTEIELDPLELLARLTQHIPPPRMHMTRLYGAYSNRRRRTLRPDPAPPTPTPTEDRAPPTPAERHRRQQWARLIAKVFELPNPLDCPCGGRFRVVALIHDPSALRRLLDHLGTLAARAPPS